MKGVVLALLLLVGQAHAIGTYTGSDGKQVALGDLPKIAVAGGTISERDFSAVLAANFNAARTAASSSKKIGLPTLNEFERLVESCSADADGKVLTAATKEKAKEKGWGTVRVGQKGGDYYSVAVVDQNGKAIAVSIICNTQVMLTSTGPDKSMEVL